MLIEWEKIRERRVRGAEKWKKKKKQTNGRAYNEDKGDYPLERGLLIMAKAIIAIILL